MQNPANSKSPPKPSVSLAVTVESQLFKMLARNLDYAPSPSDISAVTQVMIEDLQSRGLRDADAERVEQAFRTLGPHLQKWPTSRMVIDALPAARPRQSARLLMAPTSLDSYCDDYIRQHPGASKKDACLEYLKQKQLLKNLPQSLAEDEEAKQERAAIQQE